MEIINAFFDTLLKLWNTSGFMTGNWQQFAMIAIACLLFFLAVVKKFEPLLLLPIAFGILLANIPGANVIHMEYFDPKVIADLGYQKGTLFAFKELFANGGLLDILYLGVKLGIYPPLIFLGIGAMTDFGPLLANPKSLLLGAAAQLGIFVAFMLALLVGFTPQEAGSIGIIGGADGPTAIFVTKTLAPHLLGPIAIAAYSYMALVPVIQPPFMRLLTTRKEREVVMDQLREVSKTERILFPIIVTILVSLLIPDATPLVGMLMLGNLFRESGVVDRLTKTASNELINIITILLGVSVGATATGSTFLKLQTILIIILGVIAFSFGTIGGVLFGKIMYITSKGKVNPLIGSAGVSAVPMAARVSQLEGQRANPGNFLLMHAMGPNVAGVIGSAVAAGILLSLLK
ncbi:MAG: sodium ion-translocating decarboxylase subunit beta [Saccharofermentanales bacterium]